MTEFNTKLVGIGFGYAHVICNAREYKPWYNDVGVNTYTKENFRSFNELVDAVKSKGTSNIHVTIIKNPKYSASTIMKEITTLAGECDYSIIDTKFDSNKALREYRLVKNSSTPAISTAKKLSSQKMKPSSDGTFKSKMNRMFGERK